MQNIADQVDEIWNEPHSTGDAHQRGRCIPARDFMVLRLTAHEVQGVELEERTESGRETKAVMGSWAENGGAWVEAEGGRRWVGVSDAPSDDA